MGCGALSGADEVFRPELQFRKLKSIHKTQQTEIWTCENRAKEKFSVKVFKKIFINDENESMLTNFQLEIQRLYALAISSQTQKSQYGDARRHLVPYHKAWKDENGNLCMIMQYIEQSSLAQEVKGKLPGLFTQPNVAQLTEQILKTIKFLRSHGSIFCNFKTPNAFLHKDRQTILLTDYYNLQEYFKLNETTIFKNPIYSAPQNVLFNQYFMETDIWRVGCFVVELLTCIKPWYKETTSTEKIVEGLKNLSKPPIPERVSKECRNFLEKCFETDHNRRTSLEELIFHEFITLNVGKTARMPKPSDRVSYERQNTTVEEIASYNLQIQLVDTSSNQLTKKLSTRRQQSSFLATPQQEFSPLQSTRKLSMKKTSNQNLPNSYKEYQTAKVIISQNDQNLQKSTIKMKDTKIFRTKRIKTETSDSRPLDMSYNSPYSREKKSKEILQMLNKKKAINIANPYDSPTTKDYYTVSKKVSRTGNYRLNKSKKKIPTNQITLNNQVISFTDNSSSRYWPGPEIPAPFNFLETAEKMNLVMKQIEKQGGEKYYKKPLKLLKQRLKDKHTLRTETSITLQDSRALFDKSLQEVQHIDLQTSKNITSEDHLNQNETEMSKISYGTSHQNQVIETLTSKALKERFETEKKMLIKQREEEKAKWEQQLKEGRQFIKNQFNRRYIVDRNSSRLIQQIEK